MEPLHLFLLDQGFPVEYELDEFNTLYTGTTLRLPQNSLCRLRCKICSTPSYFTSGQHFSGDIHASPRNNQNHKLTVTPIVSDLNSKHDFCYTMANIFPSYMQPCLNLTMHFSLRHLAAKMLSQLYDNSISFLYFFPSYETCSINVNPLFYADIKNLHIKPNGIFVFLLLHPPLFSNNN